MVPGMDIYQPALSVGIHNTTGTLQCLMVQSTVININTIQPQILYHPIQTFQIVIVPAGIRGSNNRDIHIAGIFTFIKSIIPGRNEMSRQVLVQPFVRTVPMDQRTGILSGTVMDHFTTQAT